MSTNIIVPEFGESIIEATVIRWLKRVGDSVNAGDPLVELETEKANFEVAAEKSGILQTITKKEDTDVKVGDVLGVIDENSTPQSKETQPAEQITEKPDENGVIHKIGEPSVSERLPEIEEKELSKATPVAKRIAEEHKVDLKNVIPAGPSNRITKEDVESFVKGQKPYTESAPEQLATTIPTDERHEEKIRMSPRRRTIARRMLEAQRTAAILTTFNEVDMTAVMELRKRRKESFKERYGVGLGIVSFFVKSSIGALKEFPQLNAEVQDEYIIFKKYYDIGVAIGAPSGLVVPVLRDTDKLSFAGIEKLILEFANKANQNTLSLEDIRGGTFTISNGGVFGSLLSTPILNPPQVGILGLHKIEHRPVVINNEIQIRQRMYVALSYDHRIVDGREAVLFLVKLKSLIEDPGALLLEG